MKKRFLALDVLRGLTVTFMIIVNNPGSWSCMYPPLRHASWDGCTPCDLVFPFFLFCVGVSMALSLSKYTNLSWGASSKIFKRGALLYLTGLALTAFPFYPSAAAMDPDLNFWQNWLAWAGRLRLMGVLPRIALCYVMGSVIALWLQTPRKIGVAMGVLSVLHVGLLLLFAGPEGAFTLEGNFATKFDIAVLGVNHVYKGYGIPFDPEGIFGSLTGTCTVLLGYLIGMLIRGSNARFAENGKPEDSPFGLSARLFTISAVSLLLGLVLSIWIPLNKPLWSVSYVFYAGGWAVFVLALLTYLIDAKGWETPFFLFKAMGMNALALFVLSGLVNKSIWRFTSWDYTVVFGVNEFMSLLFALMYMLVHLMIAIILYKKKIFIKL